MNLPVDFSNERQLGAAFAYLTRAGIGMPFGSCSIHWYQTHQCAALDVLYREACRLLWPDYQHADPNGSASLDLYREDHGGPIAPRFKVTFRKSDLDCSRKMPHCNRLWVKALNGPNVDQVRELGSAGDFYARAERRATKG